MIYTGESSSPDFLDFVKFNNHALVSELGAHNFRSLGSLGRRLAIGVIDPDDTEKTLAFLKELKGFARAASDEIKQKYIFAWMNGRVFKKFLKQFRIEKSSFPEIFALDFPAREFWQDSSAFSVKEFIEAVESGDIPKQKQEHVAGRGPFQQFKMVFMEFMPWSALIMVLMFVLTFFAFLPEEKMQRMRLTKTEAPTTEVAQDEEPKKEK